MHRCSIIYNAGPGDTFNWDYYLSNHIPLAVGRSLRHSPVVKCEPDLLSTRPLRSRSPACARSTLSAATASTIF
jgi:hypothetical protein